MEYKHNFEHLTKKQNKSINEEWGEIKKLYDKGGITVQEADYYFQKWVMENFEDNIWFTICTNRKEFKMKYTIDEYAKERTINWLNGMQSIGMFEGFLENDMKFEDLSDSDIEYYFLEWYFTEDDDEVSYETELIETRKKLLENITQ